MKVKAGYKTSEFWFTLVSFLFSGLYLTGVLTENDQKEELITVVSHAVESCILIGGQLVILYKYVNGRNKIKSLAQQSTKETDNNDDRSAPKRSTNKNRSRKTNNNNKNKTTRSKKNSSR